MWFFSCANPFRIPWTPEDLGVPCVWRSRYIVGFQNRAAGRPIFPTNSPLQNAEPYPHLSIAVHPNHLGASAHRRPVEVAVHSKKTICEPRILASRGSRGTVRRARQDSRLQALLSHVWNAHERYRSLPSRRTGDDARLPSVPGGPRPIRVSSRVHGPTRLREIRTSAGHRPLHHRP